jgi:hypothetical protein
VIAAFLALPPGAPTESHSPSFVLVPVLIGVVFVGMFGLWGYLYLRRVRYQRRARRQRD